MSASILVLLVFAFLVNPTDWLGELKGALAVLVPVILYWWKQRRDQQRLDDEEQHETTDSLLRFASERDKRLDERDSKLREEERAFMHNQMELSRLRGHILGRGYMAIEMANDRLIELCRKHNVDVPQELLTLKTRSLIWAELKEVEDRQSALGD